MLRTDRFREPPATSETHGIPTIGLKRSILTWFNML